MLRSFFASLSVRLNLLVLIAILPLLGFIFHAYMQERQFQKAQVQNQALLLTQVVKSQEDRLIEGARQLLPTLALLPYVHSSNPSACNAFFTSLLKQYPLYASIGVAKRNGKVFCSSIPSAEAINFSQRPWLQRAVKQRNFAIGEYQISQFSRKPVLAFGYPVLNTVGEVKAVVFASLDLAKLNQLIAEVKLPKRATITLFDRNGTILAHYPESEKWIGKYLPAAPLIKTILTEGEGVTEAVGLDGVSRLYAFTVLNNLSDTNLYICVGIPEATQSIQSNQIVILNLLGLGLLAIGAKIAIISFGGELLILRWVRAMAQTSRRLAAGDLKARVGSYGAGELGQLAHTIDEMAESLECQITQRQQIEAEVKQLNESLEQRVQERTAQLEATNKELDAFSYSVSHDLRAPLRHISGFVDALALRLTDVETRLADSRVAHYMEVIQSSSQKMTQMIESLLTLSRLGRQQLVSRPVDIRQLVDTAIALVMQETEFNQNCPVEFTVGDLPTVIGEPTLLQQVFTNLIDNAIKFSRIRYPAKIEIGKLLDGTIFVRDNGVGFQMEYADQIFGAFQRLHSQREFKGTGIGLAIVQRIIHRHGGTIWVESAPNQGTTFYFTIKQVSEA